MNTQMEKLINNLRSEIDLILRRKTNWGRNELKIELERAYTSALIKSLVDTSKS